MKIEVNGRTFEMGNMKREGKFVLQNDEYQINEARYTEFSTPGLTYDRGCLQYLDCDSLFIFLPPLRSSDS